MIDRIDEHDASAIDAWLPPESGRDWEELLSAELLPQLAHQGVDVEKVDAVQSALDDPDVMARLDGHLMRCAFMRALQHHTLQELVASSRVGIADRLSKAGDRVRIKQAGIYARLGIDPASADEAEQSRVRGILYRPDGALEFLREHFGAAGRRLK